MSIMTDFKNLKDSGLISCITGLATGLVTIWSNDICSSITNRP